MTTGRAFLSLQAAGISVTAGSGREPRTGTGRATTTVSMAFYRSLGNLIRLDLGGAVPLAADTCSVPLPPGCRRLCDPVTSGPSRNRT
ncbi:hypothetical protein GCM10027088_46570 [Nocardia goodfellowii]